MLGNDKWLNEFPTNEAFFINEGYFDHTPVLVRCHGVIGGKVLLDIIRCGYRLLILKDW